MKNITRLLSRHLSSAIITVATIAFCHCASSALAATPAPDGLVGWWKGESNVVDSVGSASGYITNGASYGPGEVGTGFNLNGTNSQVLIPNSSSLNFGANQNFSIETWIQAQPTPGNFNGIVSIASKIVTPDAYSGAGWSLHLEYGRLGFQMLQAPIHHESHWTSQGPDLQDGQFHHVAVTVDRTSNTGGKLYVDGGLVLTFDPTMDTGDLSTDGPLYIGCHNNPVFNTYFNGIIDEVSVYSRALTDAEVQSVYQAASSGKTTGPILPEISEQPKNQIVNVGDEAIFGVTAIGESPLSYQWLHNGINITEATNNFLTISNAQAIDAGIYSVVVSTTNSSLTSSNAILTVNTPAPQGLVGWWKGESNVLNSVSGESGYETNGAGYGPGEVGTGFSLDGSSNRVVIPNSPALNFGSNQNFSVEAWIQAQPTPDNFNGIVSIVNKIVTPDIYNGAGWSLHLEYGHLGFQMLQEPIHVEHHWTTMGPDLQDGQFHHVAVAVDRTTTTGGKLFVDGSLIMTFDPTQDPGDLSTDGPLYIGCHNLLDINANFKGIIDEVSLYGRALTEDEISSIYASGADGKLLVLVPPSIITQPSNRTATIGENVTFSVVGDGSLPLSYLWRFNGTNISGTTNNYLTLTNVQSTNSGFYSVVISNSVGLITSSNAMLTVNLPLPASVPAPAGLVGWWKGESNVVDSIGDANGYETNGANYGSGTVGTGFRFNTTNNQVIIPNAAALNFGTNQNFSVEAWIQAEPTPGNFNGIVSIVSKIATPDAYSGAGWSLHLEYGRLGFQMLQAPIHYESHWTSPGPDLQDGLFHHVAATVDRTSHTGGKLYVDGKIIMTFDPTQESGDLSTEGPVYIGCHNNSQFNTYFKGIIDEVSVYNREISAAEIQSVYVAAAGGKSADPVAPFIVVQPVSRQVRQGSDLTISVGVVGAQPLTYQWIYNGFNISDGTNNSLTLTNFQPRNIGIYAVAISNAIGTITSSNAVMTIIVPVQAPQGLVGWWRGESNVVDEFSGLSGWLTNGTIHGNAEAGYGLGEVGTGFAFDGMNQQAVSPNPIGLNFGSNQNFSVEAWIQAQPVSTFYSRFAVIASKGYNGIDLTNAAGWQFYLNNGRLGFRMSQAAAIPGNFSGWSAQNLDLQDGKFHHVGVTLDRKTKTGGKLYVDGSVVLTFDPTGESGDLSNTAPLQIGTIQVAIGAMNYFKGIIDEVTIYNRELTSNEIAAVYQAADAGKFVQPSAPTIATQPVSQRIVRGENVTFEVGAGGTQPLAFQWLFNGNDLAGKTNATLVFTDVQFAQAGTYSVKVSNDIGFVTSSDAVLRVDYPPATVYVADASGSASLPITVPVVLEANGNENAVSFSVNFDPALLTFANVVTGSGAVGGSLFSNTNMVGSGKLGLILALPSGSVFSVGAHEVVKVMFNVATTLPGSTTVSLGNQPTLSQLSDVNAESLAANYEGGAVSILAADFEGDVSPRPTGDKYVTLTDWVLEGRFVARLDNPTTESEFQRADCAPQSTRGDGAITVFDWVQVGRYAVGLDSTVPAGGPLAEVASIGTLAKDASITRTADSGCEVKIVEMNLVQGRSGTLSVILDAQGTENALGFSMAFDPTAIGFVSASLGSGATGAMLNVNTNQAGTGHVGFAIALSPGQTFGTGSKEILKLNVQVAASATPGQSTFTFTDAPVVRGVSDAIANPVLATFTHGVVDVNSSIPTLHISRVDDQVVLSWADWGTNFVLQTTGNTSTNLTWINSVATTTVANGECAVKLPASAQTELYRLIQSGTQGGDTVTKQLESPSVSVAPNK